MCVCVCVCMHALYAPQGVEVRVGLKQVRVRDNNVQRLEHDSDTDKHYNTVIIMCACVRSFV